MARAGESDTHKVYLTIITILFTVIISMMGFYVRSENGRQDTIIDRWAGISSMNATRLTAMESLERRREERDAEMLRLLREINARP
jgi:hypothetical protein